LRAKIDTGAIVAPTATPKRISPARTAPRLASGQRAGQGRGRPPAPCVFGAAPTAVRGAAEDLSDRVDIPLRVRLDADSLTKSVLVHRTSRSKPRIM
jgi:hypothetical protein